MSKAKFEETVKNYMKNLDLSREEAIQLIEDEQADFIGDGEQYEEKAKEKPKKREYTKKKESKPKERKVDEEKGFILSQLKPVIDELGGLAITIKTETELSFTLNENSYTLKLTKHRPKKNA